VMEADTQIPINSEVRDDLRGEKRGGESYTETIQRLLAGETLEVMLKDDGYWLSVDTGDGLHGLYRISDGDGGYIKDEVLEQVAIDYREEADS